MHAAFVADEIWGYVLEPARIYQVLHTPEYNIIPLVIDTIRITSQSHARTIYK